MNYRFTDTSHAFKVFIEGGGGPNIETNKKVKAASEYLKEHGCYDIAHGYAGSVQELDRRRQKKIVEIDGLFYILETSFKAGDRS